MGYPTNLRSACSIGCSKAPFRSTWQSKQWLQSTDKSYLLSLYQRYILTPFKGYRYRERERDFNIAIFTFYANIFSMIMSFQHSPNLKTFRTSAQTRRLDFFRVVSSFSRLASWHVASLDHGWACPCSGSVHMQGFTQGTPSNEAPPGDDEEKEPIANGLSDFEPKIQRKESKTL